MLGQPVSMLIPRVVGFKLSGELPEGSTATDLVLTITEMLRQHGVVGKFVEFYGDGRRRAAGRQPRHHRQHEPGVRLDDRGLPDRRADHQLPPADRPPGRAAGPGRGLRQGAGPLARPDAGRAPLQRAARARPVDRRTVAGRARSGRRTGSRSPRRASRSRRRSRTTPTTRRRHRDGQPRRPGGRDRPRRRRDRRDHVVHQHLQPERDDRGGAAGQERRREGPRAQAVGQDLARAGLQGGQRLLRAGRPHAVPRQARLQPRRLRLYDVHRQLRPAHPRGQRRGQRGRPRRGQRAVGQPQLRGPDQPRREDELPRVAAAGGRLRAGRLDDRRPVRRPAGPGPRTATTCSSRTSGRRRRRSSG